MSDISPLMSVSSFLPYLAAAGTAGAGASSGSGNGSETSSGASGASSTGATGGTGGSGASGTLSSNEVNQLANPDLFIKLLVAELQNQDPTNPMDPSTILSQTANLSEMEAVTTMTNAVDAEQSAAQASEATGLIGQTVTATSKGAPITGTVTQIQLSSSGEPTLTVGGTQVSLADVTAVGTVAAAPAATGSPGAGSSSSNPSPTSSSDSSTTASSNSGTAVASSGDPSTGTGTAQGS